MKRKHHPHRPLAFEQLESKEVPSSILLVAATGDLPAEVVEFATSSVVSRGAGFRGYQYDTEQLLWFISENTTSAERAHRTAPLPTTAHCEAADEMMRRVEFDSTGLLVLGFLAEGDEL